MLSPELGSGPLAAPLWIIGRDYGAEEARWKRPFVGPAGSVLDGVLKFAGLRRDEARVDNLVPVQPPGNDWMKHHPGDVQWGRERLAALLQRYKPRLTIALGNEVSEFLLGDAKPDAGIQELRGYLWDTTFGRILTTVHPASVLREWTPWRALLGFDMRRAAEELRLGCPPLKTRAVTTVVTAADLEGLHAALRNQVGSDQARHALPEAALDTENTGDLKLACLGVAPSPDQAWVIPACENWQLDAIRELCESPVPKALQNGQYDRFFLRRFAGIELRSQVFDTQLAWHVLQPELAGKKVRVGPRRGGYSRTTVKSLRFLASIYVRDGFWKRYDFQNENERYELCGRDCCVTLEIALKQARQLEEA